MGTKSLGTTLGPRQDRQQPASCGARGRRIYVRGRYIRGSHRQYVLFDESADTPTSVFGTQTQRVRFYLDKLNQWSNQFYGVESVNTVE